MLDHSPLRSLIRRADLSHSQFAKAVAVDPAYVSAWVYGRRLPALAKRAEAVSFVLGVPEEVIVAFTRPPSEKGA
jgi:hypothetical protein